MKLKMGSCLIELERHEYLNIGVSGGKSISLRCGDDGKLCISGKTDIISEQSTLIMPKK